MDKKDEKKLFLCQMQLAALDRAIALLELKAAQLDMLWSAVDDEMIRRTTFIKALKKVSPEIGAALESKKCDDKV